MASADSLYSIDFGSAKEGLVVRATRLSGSEQSVPGGPTLLYFAAGGNREGSGGLIAIGAVLFVGAGDFRQSA